MPNWVLTTTALKSIFILPAAKSIIYFSEFKSSVFRETNAIDSQSAPRSFSLRGVVVLATSLRRVAPACSFLSRRRRPPGRFGSAFYSSGLGPGGGVLHACREARVYPRTSPTDREGFQMCAATAKQMEISLSSPSFRVRPVRIVGPVRTGRTRRTSKGKRGNGIGGVWLRGSGVLIQVGVQRLADHPRHAGLFAATHGPGLEFLEAL